MQFEPHRSHIADFVALMLVIAFGLAMGLILGLYVCYKQIQMGVLSPGQGISRRV